MWSFLRYPVTLLFILTFTSLSAQDIIIRTNGAQISAKVIEITDDSVKYKIKTMPGNPVFSLARSEVKMIEYWNGKRVYQHGDYSNMSEEGTSTVITGAESTVQKVTIEGIQFHIERLFTEYHLMLDYTLHPDSNFIASKGKIEFDFENSKDNFFVKNYPTGEKTSFAKFLFNETGENKKYSRLCNKLLVGMIIFYEDSVSRIVFDQEQAINIKEMFSGKEMQNKP